jgi:hypothetical protein
MFRKPLIHWTEFWLEEAEMASYDQDPILTWERNFVYKYNGKVKWLIKNISNFYMLFIYDSR